MRWCQQGYIRSCPSYSKLSQQGTTAMQELERTLSSLVLGREVWCLQMYCTQSQPQTQCYLTVNTKIRFIKYSPKNMFPLNGKKMSDLMLFTTKHEIQMFGLCTCVWHYKPKPPDVSKQFQGSQMLVIF